MAFAELAAVGFACKNAFGVALADTVERFSSDHMEVIRLGVHRGRRTHRHGQDFFEQVLRHGLFKIATDRTPPEHDFVIFLVWIAAHLSSSLKLCYRGLAQGQLHAKYVRECGGQGVKYGLSPAIVTRSITRRAGK